MERSCQVLIVDDSTVFRSQIRAALDGVTGVEVAGFASNGKLACDVLKNKHIDVVTLDLEMPVMGGLEVLAEIKRLGLKVKVVVFSSHTKTGAEATMKALSLGASDFLPKPQLQDNDRRSPAEVIRAQLLPKILQFTEMPKIPSDLAPERILAGPQPSSAFPKVNWATFAPKAIVIASSTGGPNALEKFFALLAPPLRCPILIAQHMPPVFTATLAERLRTISGIQVSEAQHDEPLQQDKVYIAPGNFHMRLVQRQNGVFIQLDQEPQRNSVRPAADHLFESAASIFKSECFGIVLTGMGADGRDGAIAIKRSNGAIMIQDKASCVVFGMPGAVFESGAYDKMGTISEICQQLNALRVCDAPAKAG